MLQYFFTPEFEIPADTGFSRFHAEHITALLILAAVSAVVIVLGCRMNPEKRQRLLKGMAVSLIVLEWIKIMVLGWMGTYSVGYLPLHLCGYAMFICLFAAWHPNSAGGGQLLWGLVFTGGVLALLFPDWTNFPILHFQSLHSFLYHAILVQFSLISVISGQAAPRLRQLWKTGLFLLISASLTYMLNLQLHTNYMFLMHPVPGSPLMLCARLPGKAGYLIGYAILASVVLIVLDLPFALWALRKRHSAIREKM